MSMPLPVMIVVNELGIAYLFNPTLERFSFNMISFIDPLLALDHFTQYPRRYCLILVDMIIVNLNGQELAKEIRKYNFDVKILLITGYCKGDIRHSIDFKAAKISDVILKPVNFAILEPKILQLCSENKPASSNNKI
jgi:DNA-binding NtrC family response regulator